MTEDDVAELSHATMATPCIDVGSPRDPQSAASTYEKRLPNAR